MNENIICSFQRLSDCTCSRVKVFLTWVMVMKYYVDAQRNKIWYLFLKTFSAWSKVVIFKSLFLHFSGEQESEKTITRFALTLDSLPETLKWTFSTCNWTLLALSHRISSNVFTHGNKQFGQRSKHSTDKQYTPFSHH